MKLLYKSAPQNELTVFAQAYPDADWDNDFRNYAVPPNMPGHDYKEIKKRLISDQGGLCAYCEKQIGCLNANLQKIEHFHPKSDKSNLAINWALNWSNVLAVCTGGEHENRTIHPLPENLSCDSHKNYFMIKNPGKLPQFINDLLNPLQISAFPCLFDFDKRSGALTPNQSACQYIDLLQNLATGQTQKKLLETINILNLNCDRLCTDRLLVLFQYNKEVTKAKKLKDNKFKQKLVAKWFSSKWPSFFTTRRILLGKSAEAYLQSIPFQG